MSNEGSRISSKAGIDEGWWADGDGGLFMFFKYMDWKLGLHKCLVENRCWAFTGSMIYNRCMNLYDMQYYAVNKLQ